VKTAALDNYGTVHILPEGTPVFFERSLSGAIACIRSARRLGGVARICNGTQDHKGTLLHPNQRKSQP
jgi:hypothetical protein